MDKEKDIFSEIVKEKLTNYSLPPDDDSWEKIEERLTPASRGKIQTRWIAVLAIAASIALLFLLFPFNKKTQQHETASQLSDHEETIIQNVPEKGTDQSVLSQNVEHPKVFKKSQSVNRLAENNLATEVTSTEENTEDSSSIPAKEEPAVKKNHPASIGSSPDFEKETPMPAIKRKKRQSIRFSFGSGESLLAENGTGSKSFVENINTDFAYFRSAVQTVTDSRANDILSYESYPDVNYHSPLSFGLTIKKELNQTFSIESGIVYSFLETTFSRQIPQRSTADLQLHYLGIPLNLHTRILRDRLSRWEVYLSTGGMVEKGLFSHFVQKNYLNGSNYSSVESFTSNERINGLQWSVSISPGIDYQIYKNYSIYLEPKVSYYFDNNQPVSARTEHPVVIGINAGVRYSW